MATKRRFLCRDHGEADACLVCVHLHRGRGRGFHSRLRPETEATYAGLNEAWCNRCNFWRRRPAPLPAIYAFLTGGPMMVCEHCLELARIANER